MLYDNNKNKIISNEFLNLPKEKLSNLLLGLIETDGSRLKELYFHSTSKNVIESLRFILLKLGNLKLY